tara:strand:+ start:1000 stop:2007 length:1008 start_codon:yes stop_codon:yes gene_type:complete
MWPFLADYGLFLLKVLTLVFAVLIILMQLMRMKLSKSKDPIVLEKLNDTYHDIKIDFLEQFSASGAGFAKSVLQAEKKARKTALKIDKKNKEPKHKTYILNFKGNMTADSVKFLREEITAILLIAMPGDRVMVKVDSPGGSVIDYGLTAAQLVRIRDAGLDLVVCVDRIAASGGYMMACVAHTICAAPFAVIGSIGVVTQIPNFNAFLKKHDIDIIELTAGQHKRPLSVLGKATSVGKQHVQLQLQAIHQQFKDMVGYYRPNLDVDKVATGDYWTAEKSLELGLIDRLMTSDQYIMESIRSGDVYAVKTVVKPSFKDNLLGTAQVMLDRFVQYYG